MEKTSVMAMIAIIAALGSFALTFSGHYIGGLLAAIISIPCGIAGVVMAASPRVSGGILSIVAIVLGIFAAGIWVMVSLGAIVF